MLTYTVGRWDVYVDTFLMTFAKWISEISSLLNVNPSFLRDKSFHYNFRVIIHEMGHNVQIFWDAESV